MLLPPTPVTEGRVEGVQGRIHRRPAEVVGCLQCGLQLGVDSVGEAGGTVLLVTGADLATISLPQGPHSLAVLSYRGQGDRLGKLPGEVTVYSVTEDGGKENPVVRLTEVFIDINNVEEEQVQKVLSVQSSFI